MGDESTDMNPLYKDILLAALKYFGGMVLASLATRHVISVDQSQQLLDDLTHKAIAYAPALLLFGAIVWKIVKNRATLVIALWKAGLTEEQAKMMLANPTIVTPTVRTPSNTIPGVPKP